MNLILHLSLATVPLIAFTAILTGLIYRNPFNQTQVEGNLYLDDSSTSEVLYVNYTSTQLILVASWSSSAALPIIASLLTFTSYTVAADLMWSSQQGHHALLPTPSQIAMLTDLLDAKQMAIVTWLASFWRKDGRKVPSRWIVEFPAIIQLAALSLSAAIIAADTWLHVATKSVTVPFLVPISDTESFGMGYDYSRTLTTDCDDTSEVVCTVQRNSTGTGAFASFPSDISSLATADPGYPTCINTSSDGGHFLAPQLPQRAGLITTNSLIDQTFTANSFYSNASCVDVTDQCNGTSLNSDATVWNFTCDGGMIGQVDQFDPVQIGSWWQGNGTYNDMFQHYENSSQVEVVIVMLLMNITFQPKTGISVQPDNVTNNVLVGARCDLILTAVQYDWTNTTSTATTQNFTDGTPSEDLARLVRGPILAGYFDSHSFTGVAENNPFMNNSFMDNPSVQGLVQFQNSTKVLGNTLLGAIGRAISFYGISLLGGAITFAPTAKLSLPDSVIVTEVRKAPLFTLVILNLWYAGFGVLLFALAMFILRDPNSGEDIREIQKLISVHGLATAAVKRHRRNLDSSDLRVGVEKVDGVWQFRVFEVNGISGESKPLLDAHDEDMQVAQAWNG